MKCIVVTPAGRKRYMALLFEHLKRQRADFQEWHLWINTNNSADIAYMEELEQQNPDWIKCVRAQGGVGNNWAIGQFFKHCVDPDTVYIRIDDDVVWLEPGFICKLAEYRVANPQPFLVYANIINNAHVTHQHAAKGTISVAGYGNHVLNEISSSHCEVCWRSPVFAEHLHRTFLSAIESSAINKWHLENIPINPIVRVSVNAISWLGSEFAKFGGIVSGDEEHWLSKDKPTQLGVDRCNYIFGGALCAHFAFYTQRDHLDSTDLLDRYAALLKQ